MDVNTFKQKQQQCGIILRQKKEVNFKITGQGYFDHATDKIKYIIQLWGALISSSTITEL